jgi:hypothetical protein
LSQDTERSKDAALRAVGRTVVNFQRLEHNLKLAAQLGPAQGTIQKIQRDLEKRKERAGALTLGQAIQAWLNYLDGDTAEPAWTPDLFDLSVRMTFSLDPAEESPDSHAQALRSLLDIRNSLIHTRLATFPWDSADACNKLVTELDSVNTSVVEQLVYVAALLREIAIAHKEYAEAVVAAISGPSVKHAVGEAMPNPPLERP